MLIYHQEDLVTLTWGQFHYIPQPLFIKISLKFTYLKFDWNLPGANELILCIIFSVINKFPTFTMSLLLSLSSVPSHSTVTTVWLKHPLKNLRYAFLEAWGQAKKDLKYLLVTWRN